jgi:hypothetical protein
VKVFGWIFVVVGLALAAISINAALDPNTIYEGWERFQKDAWAGGIGIGGVLATVGAVLLAAAPRVGARTRLLVGRVIAVLVFGFIGFLLFAPFEGTTACFDGLNGGHCETQNWSTITGVTFDGEVSYTLAVVSALVFAAITIAFFLWRSRRKPQGTVDPLVQGSA